MRDGGSLGEGWGLLGEGYRGYWVRDGVTG